MSRTSAIGVRRTVSTGGSHVLESAIHIILLFEAKSNVSITAQAGTHYKMGTRIGQAFPVI